MTLTDSTLLAQDTFGLTAEHTASTTTAITIRQPLQTAETSWSEGSPSTLTKWSEKPIGPSQDAACVASLTELFLNETNKGGLGSPFFVTHGRCSSKLDAL